MGKANSGDNSSLELLLDTMCNTFGAVMFIAISLLIVISMLGKVTSAIEHLPETEAVKNMQDQLARLEAEYAQSRKMLDLLKPFAERLKNDPRREILERYFMLKSENVRLENQQKIQHLQQETEEKLQQILQKKKEELAKQLKQKKELQETLAEKLEILKKTILFISQALSTRKPESSLVFRYLQASDKAPYFILLRHGRLWRIGPYIGRGITVHPDVTCKKWNTFYSCTPAAPGTVVLNGSSGTLTEEALALIRGTPEDRFPSFQVYPDSAREMFLIREMLKKEKIRHAFSTNTNADLAGFAFRENVKYETD